VISSSTANYQPLAQQHEVGQSTDPSIANGPPGADNMDEAVREESTFLDMVLPSFLRPVTESPELAARNGQLPQDLPHSPVLAQYVVGDAPVLPLADPSVLEASQDQEEVRQDTTQVVSNARTCQTVIPQGWSFNGDVTGEEDMTFACRLVGNVENTNAQAFVAMGEMCQSEGSITASKIYLKGMHTGRVNGEAGLVVIEDSARVTGDVAYNQIQIHGGSHNMRLQYVGADFDNVS
jgi:cytoskeletal protein CcmA (bactofilin family)